MTVSFRCDECQKLKHGVYRWICKDCWEAVKSGKPSPAGGCAMAGRASRHCADGDEVVDGLRLKKVTEFDGEGQYIHEVYKGRYKLIDIDCKCKRGSYAWNERRWWKICK